MPRTLTSVILCAGIFGFAGCAAHQLETRAISAFIESLEKSDLSELKAATSVEFKETALRHKEAVDAFKLLNLPVGKVEVLEVKDEEDGRKRVLVQIGERKRKLYCHLVQEPESKKWVVDDIEDKRKLKPGEVKKTIAQQMDLLISVQEVLDSWRSGQRDEILAACHPELRSTLEKLPPGALTRFVTQVTSDLSQETISPKIEGHANTALALIPRKSGEVRIKLHLVDGKWLAEDIAVASKREEHNMSSLRKNALVMLTAIQFCEAYQAENKAELERLCLAKFYRLNLQAADLKQVPIPLINTGDDSYDIRIIATRGEVVLKQPEQVVQISLSQGPIRFDDKGEMIADDADSNKPFLVEEVTFHSLKTGEDKRLSALYSSQSIVQIMAQALANRDLKVVQLSSTSDFNERVWKRIELDQLGMLPLEAIESAPPRTIDTRFQGPVTEVTVDQGETPLTYVLRDQNGTFLVDDILIPALERPNSLKQNLEVIIPLRMFTEGLRNRDVNLLRANASREFNKLVFQSMDHLPSLKVAPVPYLDLDVHRIQLTADRALLVVGDDRYGAKVFMNRENERFAIDDVVLVGGLEQGERTGLKLMFRQIVVTGTQFGSQMANPQTRSSIQQVGHDELESEVEPPRRSGSSGSHLRRILGQ